MFPKDEDFCHLRDRMETLETQNTYLLNVVILLAHCHSDSLHPLLCISHGKNPLLQLLTWVTQAHLLSSSSRETLE
jgi:hypothetical protein